MDRTDWSSEAFLELYALEQSEYGRDHNSIEMETQVTALVREGNVEALEKIFRAGIPFDDAHIGKMASKPEKQQEYACVVLLTLISRAAVDGGMNREKAYSLADVYLQRLEKCKTEEDIVALEMEAQMEFTKAVKAAKAERSRFSYIEDCKAFIDANLRRPFKVRDIAPAIGVNPSYLAARFSQIEGVTIQRYITRKRCAHAANLLRYSSYSISMISEYFCFSSQSHFGRAFKAQYSMTPKEYRNTHRIS